jgi:type II secretory pathway pseudopilin PulG
VVIAIIAILIALLVPAVEKERADRAMKEKVRIAQRFIEIYKIVHTQTGHYPQSFDELADWCDGNQEICPPQYTELRAAGQLNGWQFTIVIPNTEGVPATDSQGFQIEAEPMFPGITGSESFVIDQNGNFVSFPTPGAEEAERQMFARIRDRAAETISDLLAMNKDAFPLVRDYVGSPDTSASVFQTLDRNYDGMVSVEEIQNLRISDSAQPDPLTGFLAYVSDEMKLDMLSADERAQIGVHFSDLQGDPTAQFFSYGGLCDLTKMYVNKEGVASAMCAKLSAAAAAEERGDFEARNGAVTAYLNQLAAQSGKSLTRKREMTLNNLIKTRYDAGKNRVADVR